MSESRSVAVVLATGVAAAVVLGKALPFLDQIMDQFDLSLAGGAWLTSGVTAIAAVGAAGFGRWASLREPRRLLILSLVVLGVAGVASALSPYVWMLLAVRVVEGVGYLGVVVIGPSLLGVVIDGPTARRSALAWWGACIPIGLGLAAAAGGLSGWLGWRGWFVAVGFLCLSLAVVVFVALPVSPPLQRTDAPTDEGVGGGRLSLWLLAFGFMLISAAGVAVVAVLPAYLQGEQHLSLSSAGLVTSVVAVASATGSVLASASFRFGAKPQTLMLAALAMPVAGIGLFRMTWPTPGTVSSGALLMLFNGLAVSALFAALPAVADTAGLPAAAGLLTQFGSVGTLVGPPTLGITVDHFGWDSPVLLLTAAVVVGVGCGVTAARLSPASRQ